MSETRRRTQRAEQLRRREKAANRPQQEAPAHSGKAASRGRKSGATFCRISERAGAYAARRLVRRSAFHMKEGSKECLFMEMTIARAGWLCQARSIRSAAVSAAKRCTSAGCCSSERTASASHRWAAETAALRRQPSLCLPGLIRPRSSPVSRQRPPYSTPHPRAGRRGARRARWS